jgi:PAS domain S-box-containing protein
MISTIPSTPLNKDADPFAFGEHQALQMIAGGAPLIDVLNNLCDMADAHAPDLMTTVMLMDRDGERLRPVAGRRVPQGWIDAISPLTIGPKVGSCGTAAFLKRRVISIDISTDPLWEDCRQLAMSHGLHAAWSQPLLSKNGELLGTFAMYYNERKEPSESELRLIENAANMAVIAIEGERSQTVLKAALDRAASSEAELRIILDAVPQQIVVLGTDGANIYANQAVMDYTGLSKGEVMGQDFRPRVFHPEDIERLRGERREALLRGVPFENEQRMQRKDGQYRWFLIRYSPVRDESGKVVRWYATGTDIDDRKRAEERTAKENLALREEIDRSSMFEEIVGSSGALRKVLAELTKVAPTDSTVLITGETGTGKELIARAIHRRSRRANRAFIVVNCAAIPQSLIASELFGHEKGAFTGAVQRRTGRFEAADGGTIFLDEIGELPMEMQVALLRVLQEREFERVGGTESVRVDVRVLAATNRDLQRAVDSGTFREDLFYRLNVFPIYLPPLRERPGDIRLLVEYLIDRFAKKAGRKFTDITQRSLQVLMSYDWPGNIRELQNVIERAVVLCERETFSVDETWFKHDHVRKPSPAVPLSSTIAGHEKELIERALAESLGRISGPRGAAAKLGIPRQTLQSKILSLGIDKHRFKSQRPPSN